MSTDFDIDNYSLADLLHIINMHNKIPLTKEKILAGVKEMKDKFQGEDKQNFRNFFEEIGEKLKQHKDDINRESGYFDDTSVDNFIIADRSAVEDKDYSNSSLKLEEKIGDKYDPYNNKNVSGYDEDPGRNYTKRNPETGEYETKPIGNVVADLDDFNIVLQSKGLKTKMNRKKLSREVIVDSRNRTILDSSSVSISLTGGNVGNCPNVNISNLNKKLESPSDYNFNLNEPLKNVYEIAIKSATIKNSWYVFNKNYGTNYFTITDNSNVFHTITITEGNYTKAQLMSAINAEVSVFDMVFSYNSINNKVNIANNSGTTRTIKWYDPVVPQCSSSGNGQKVDHNMGTLMGFTELAVSIDSGSNINSPGVIDVVGTRYLYICLDDFCNSKPNITGITNSTNKASYKLPSYYVRPTMFCNNQQQPISTNNGCGKKYVNLDISRNLTTAQKYTIDQIRLAMAGSSIDRYDSADPVDLLATIPVNRTEDNFWGDTVYINNNLEFLNRVYFGPVNLQKFRVRLMDDKGMIVDLNDTDWSFTLIVKYIYQS